MLEKEQIREVIDKLIGDVKATGESRHDEKAYDNLIVMTYVCDWLLDEIRSSSQTKDRVEYSMSMVGFRAYSYLEDITCWLEEVMGKQNESNTCD